MWADGHWPIFARLLPAKIYPDLGWLSRGKLPSGPPRCRSEAYYDRRSGSHGQEYATYWTRSAKTATPSAISPISVLPPTAGPSATAARNRPPMTGNRPVLCRRNKNAVGERQGGLWGNDEGYCRLPCWRSCSVFSCSPIMPALRKNSVKFAGIDHHLRRDSTVE